MQRGRKSILGVNGVGHGVRARTLVFVFVHKETDKDIERTLWRTHSIPPVRYRWRFARSIFAKKTVHCFEIPHCLVYKFAQSG
jgi:hypothetical protein